jgi:hypothetical protein
MIIPFGFFASSGPAPFVGVLDPYTSNIWTAFGIKRLLSTYTGALIRVRRSSDNAELDIGYLTDGTLDTVTMLAHCGAGDGFVVTQYGQAVSDGSGGMVSPSTAAQPKIVASGVYLGSWQADGSNDVVQSTNNMPANAALTFAGRYALRALSAGVATSSIMTHSNLGVAAHVTLAVQQQGANSGKLNAYAFNGTGPVFRTNDYSLATTSEVADMLIGNLALTTSLKMAYWRNGSAVSLNASSSSGGDPTGNFTAEKFMVAAIVGSQFAQMNGKWFAAWSNDQTANGVGISGAL